MVKLRKIEESDLEFLLEVRNDETTRYYLVNDNTFNLEECTEWFRETQPKLLIIENELGERVGYFKTNDSNEIGCDIHPDFRRKGYARKAYQEYLKENTDVSLWVFRDNFALNLYSDLGFVENGESKEIRGREFIQMTYSKS